MDESLRELYQEVILDHSRRPHHFGVLSGATHEGEGFNPLCGDKVKIYLAVDAAGKIAKVGFEGKGCAISQASASLMTDLVVGRDVAEAEKLMEGFLHLVKGEDAGALSADDRETLAVMAGVSEFPMRVKCATLAWHTMKSALEDGKKP
jgi:nitrogen fixation protein NifU and related proteins